MYNALRDEFKVFKAFSAAINLLAHQYLREFDLALRINNLLPPIKPPVERPIGGYINVE